MSIIAQASLNDFFQSNRNLNTLFSNYILQPTNSNRLSFESELSYAENIINQIISDVFEPDYKLRFTSLRNMLDTFKEKSGDSITLLGTSEQNKLYELTGEVVRVNYLIDYSYKKYMDLFIQSQTSLTGSLLRSMRINGIICVIIITAGLLSVSFVFLILSKKITNPIIIMAKNTAEISRHNFSVPKITVNSNDEIRYLAEAFNAMQADIMDYILLKEASIKTLQSQMNSHFLLNTLNLISRTAYFEGALKTIQLIDTTTDFLKYSLGKKDVVVSIADEIAFAETYITIQRMRFEDRITIDLLVDDDLPDIQVPSLIIQPLLENAIIHGAYDKVTETEITLKITADGKYLTITVHDNGNGADPEELKNIYSKGSGLSNTRERLKIFLGGDDGISVTSEKGKFFKAEIKIEYNRESYGL
jgi:sensor histidine kinase YesM